MLRLLSSSHKLHHHHFVSTPRLPVASESPTSPLLNPLSSITELTRLKHGWYRKAFFCSDSSSPDKGGPVEVLALPLSHRPLFPGFFVSISVKDPKLMVALQGNYRRQGIYDGAYVGAFLLKDEPGTYPSAIFGSESEENISDVRGKELLSRLHKVGTLAQISSFHEDEVILIGRGRLQITEMVSEDPLTVKVDHLKNKPSNKGDDDIKAVSSEVIATLALILRANSLWIERLATCNLIARDFTYTRLADIFAAISSANKLQCQKVLEELDVDKRLDLALELVKKEIVITEILRQHYNENPIAPVQAVIY